MLLRGNGNPSTSVTDSYDEFRGPRPGETKKVTGEVKSGVVGLDDRQDPTELPV